MCPFSLYTVILAGYYFWIMVLFPDLKSLISDMLLVRIIENPIFPPTKKNGNWLEHRQVQEVEGKFHLSFLQREKRNCFE